MRKIFRLTILASSMITSHVALADAIKHITIAGNKRIETSTVQNYLGLHIGDECSVTNQNKAIKNLYATSMFENINVHCANGTLFVNVQESPFITKIELRGNNKIKTSTITKELMTHAGESLSKAKLQHDTDKILEMYKKSGRFSVAAEPVIEDLGQGRVRVIFDISEGPKASIRRIYFAGNNNYRSNELGSIILTKETAWWKFMDTNDTYDPDRMEYDKELLKNFYQSVGFADVRIISATAELSPNKEYFTATYSIDEGEKYKFGEIAVDNKISDINTEQVKKLITVRKGQTFDMSALDKIADKISEEMNNMGYPQVSVSPELKKDATTSIADVVFVVERADKAFINKINISGNTKTSEEVIRREFSIQEGDVFNRSRIEKGERNLRNLDYFDSKIGITSTPTNKPGKYDINVAVAEKSTAAIDFGLGYNTSEGPFGNLSFNERNFLGKGQYLFASTHRAQKHTSYTLGLTDPHFMGKDLSLGGQVFNNKSGKSGRSWGEDGQPYSLDTIGAKTSLGYNLAEDLTHDIDYTIKNDKLTVEQRTASVFVAEEAGKFTTSAIGHTITYDRADNRIVPKNGYILSGSQAYAGVGGNNHFLKHDIDARFFKSFVNNKVTLKCGGEVGDIRGTGGHRVRISDKFQIGGRNLRGFAPSGIGPRDKRTREALGGLNYYTGSAELNFPVGLPEEMNFTGAVFADMGSLWGMDIRKDSLYTKNDVYNSKKLRTSAGIGFIWITRIAPIRIYWGQALNRQRYDEQQHFLISMSTNI
ncbi:MAG: outer membrane protein assembly factor BamA [Pseudomonadota bacterium]